MAYFHALQVFPDKPNDRCNDSVTLFSFISGHQFHSELRRFDEWRISFHRKLYSFWTRQKGSWTFIRRTIVFNFALRGWLAGTKVVVRFWRRWKGQCQNCEFPYCFEVGRNYASLYSPCKPIICSSFLPMLSPM